MGLNAHFRVNIDTEFFADVRARVCWHFTLTTLDNLYTIYNLVYISPFLHKFFVFIVKMKIENVSMQQRK
jgi:hypothetical protein